MKKTITIAITLMVLLAGCTGPKTNNNNGEDNSGLSISQGREYLSQANYNKAIKAAKTNQNTDDGKHLLGDLHFLHGRYQEAKNIYEQISKEYKEYQKVQENLISLYVHHLKDIEAARVISAEQKENSWSKLFADAVTKPIEVVNKGTFEIPMLTDDPLNAYIPRIAGSINGSEQILTFDTGGNYLAMSSSTARSLGIEYDENKFKIGKQGYGTSKIWVGVADSLMLGEEIEMKNVPTIILSEINMEVIIFGTNIIKEFVSTIDYPNNKFVLTTKDNKEMVSNHLGKYQGNKMDFVMWDDHYMMGKGKYNGHDVNMFFDSGLVIVGAIDGLPAQAWLNMTKENMDLLNVEEKDSAKVMEVTKTNDTLEFAGLVNENALITLNPRDEGFVFNGINNHLLVSHGVISKYAWTIDFDNMEYIFK